MGFEPSTQREDVSTLKAPPSLLLITFSLFAIKLGFTGPPFWVLCINLWLVTGQSYDGRWNGHNYQLPLPTNAKFHHNVCSLVNQKTVIVSLRNFSGVVLLCLALKFSVHKLNTGKQLNVAILEVKRNCTARHIYTDAFNVWKIFSWGTRY